MKLLFLLGESEKNLFKAVRREFVRLGGMELIPVRMHRPQVLKAEWIWEIVARDSREEKESDVKRGVESMTGTWLILIDGLCFGGI
jgi:hypothetical protein